MPMTHVLQISAKNLYQKTGIIKWHKNSACPIGYQKLVPEKCRTKLHVRCVGNQHQFSATSFLDRFLALMGSIGL